VCRPIRQEAEQTALTYRDIPGAAQALLNREPNYYSEPEKVWTQLSDDEAQTRLNVMRKING
jgi:hypothetical protein